MQSLLSSLYDTHGCLQDFIALSTLETGTTTISEIMGWVRVAVLTSTRTIIYFKDIEANCDWTVWSGHFLNITPRSPLSVIFSQGMNLLFEDYQETQAMEKSCMCFMFQKRSRTSGRRSIFQCDMDKNKFIKRCPHFWARDKKEETGPIVLFTVYFFS